VDALDPAGVPAPDEPLERGVALGLLSNARNPYMNGPLKKRRTGSTSGRWNTVSAGSANTLNQIGIALNVLSGVLLAPHWIGLRNVEAAERWLESGLASASTRLTSLLPTRFNERSLVVLVGGSYPALAVLALAWPFLGQVLHLTPSPPYTSWFWLR
jgi:hypothetical protein